MSKWQLWKPDRPSPAIHTGYTSVPGRLLMPFHVPLSVWWLFSTVRFCGCFFPHSCVYIFWFLVTVLSVGRGILTGIVVFPHRRCRATLSIEDEGVWCRRPLRCLRQTALYDNMVGWNRFTVTFSLRFGLLIPLGAPRIFNPQSFFLRGPVQPNLCSVSN